MSVISSIAKSAIIPRVGERETNAERTERHWRVDGSIAIAGMVVAALAAIGGSYVAIQATERQLEQEQTAALRTERMKVFGDYVVVAEQKYEYRLDHGYKPPKDVTDEDLALFKEYNHKYALALFYASDEQSEALQDIHRKINEPDWGDSYSSYTQRLLALLKQDILFESQ